MCIWLNIYAVAPVLTIQDLWTLDYMNTRDKQARMRRYCMQSVI